MLLKEARTVLSPQVIRCGRSPSVIEARFTGAFALDVSASILVHSRNCPELVLNLPILPVDSLGPSLVENDKLVEAPDKTHFDDAVAVFGLCPHVVHAVFKPERAIDAGPVHVAALRPREVTLVTVLEYALDLIAESDTVQRYHRTVA